MKRQHAEINSEITNLAYELAMRKLYRCKSIFRMYFMMYTYLKITFEREFKHEHEFLLCFFSVYQFCCDRNCGGHRNCGIN